MKSDPVFVLDLGASKATCVCAHLDEKSGFHIEAIASTPCTCLKRGVVVDGRAATTAIRTVVEAAAEQARQDADELIVSLSGTHVEGANSQGLKPIVPRGRSITYQDVLEVINHSRSFPIPTDREQVQALPRSFNVDSNRNIHRPIGMSAGKLEVTTYLVTGTNAGIHALNGSVREAGYHVEQFVFAPLAAGIGVLTQEEMERGAVVVDIGAGITNVGVFGNGSIAHGICLPIAGANVTADLSQLLKTSFEEAERLKIENNLAYSKMVDSKETVDVLQEGQEVARPLQRKVLTEIVESRMREIARMVKEQIERSGLQNDLPGGVVLTGGGSLMLGTDKVFLENVGQYKVRRAEPQIPNFDAIPGSSVAVGLASFALQCFDELTPPPNSSLKDRVKSLFSMISNR